jgi:hypothetical protein
MIGLKEDKEGNLKYKNVKIIPTPTEAFPTQVLIEKAPARLKTLIGRKWITVEKAIIAIDTLSAEKLIQSGLRGVVDDLAEISLPEEILPPVRL